MISTKWWSEKENDTAKNIVRESQEKIKMAQKCREMFMEIKPGFGNI